MHSIEQTDIDYFSVAFSQSPISPPEEKMTLDMLSELMHRAAEGRMNTPVRLEDCTQITLLDMAAEARQ